MVHHFFVFLEENDKSILCIFVGKLSVISSYLSGKAEECKEMEKQLFENNGITPRPIPGIGPGIEMEKQLFENNGITPRPIPGPMPLRQFCLSLMDFFCCCFKKSA